MLDTSATEKPQSFIFRPSALVEKFIQRPVSELDKQQGLAFYRAKLNLHHLALLREFDELRRLDTMKRVERYW